MGSIFYNAQPGTSDAALYTGQPGMVTPISKIIAWNTTGLGPPAAPTVGTAATGGTILAGTYQVEITYVTAAGETLASPSTTQVTAGTTSTITITSPGAASGATGWYAYVTQAGGSVYTRQQAGAATAIATNLTLTAPPTSTGANQPAVNTSAAAVTLNLSVHRVISGAVETVASALPIPALNALSLLEDRLLAMEEVTLDPGDSLHGSASAGSSISVLAFT